MTTNSAFKSLPRIMTIASVHQPVSRYLEGRLGRRSEEGPLSPLDSYLIHLTLEFSPRRVFVMDLACGSTWGASSVVCLANGRVGRVSSRVDASSATSTEPSLADRIAEFASEAKLPAAHGFSSLPTGGREGWESHVAEQLRRDFPVVLLPASSLADGDGAVLESILKNFPEAVVLVLGNGRLGVDRSARGLVCAMQASKDLRFWLLREHSPALNSSGVAVVAAQDNRIAGEIVKRLEGVFTTNYDFLTLVRDSCLYAFDRGVRNELSSQSHWTSTADARDRPDDPSSVVVESALRREVVRESIRSLQDQVQRLESRLAEEENRPLSHSLVRRSARRVVRFGRRHRQIFAPKGSMRERMARSILQMGRGVFRS